MITDNSAYKGKFLSLLLFLVMTSGVFMMSGCVDTLPDVPDYTRAGEEVKIKIALTWPGMNVRTRAALDERSLNEVSSLWIRTYSSESGNATSKWLKVEDLPKFDTETGHEVTISTLSGPSYIVGVANVDNPGVTKDNIGNQQPLSTLLENADTWREFLDIAAVTPSTPMTVRAPLPPLAMAGCFTTIAAGGSHPEPARIDEWQNKDFQSYFIPAGEGTVDFTTTGAIHLRRLVSHINFNIIPAEDLEVEVTGYQVMNAPKWTWLYERPSTSGMLTNFGDITGSEEEAEEYYVDIPQYGPQFITEHPDGTSSFDFWQGENKHTGTSEIYYDRDKVSPTSPGHFVSLSGETWTPDNEASYILLHCDITYRHPINVDPEGVMVSTGGESVDRTAEALYIIHLGGMEGDAKDFNCFRNVDYTYNVRINGVDDIRVDAFAVDGTEIYHGEEGIVVDLSNNTVDLDAHYSVFNIQLTEAELKDENFGFIIITYDNGEQISISDSNIDPSTGRILDANGNLIPSKYYDWIELRPTTGEFVLADYKPRYGVQADGSTFLLTDLYNGWNSMTDKMKSDEKGWYTVFVNEYTYEPIYTGTEGYANESVTPGERPAWMSYVNQPPRNFYVIVSRQVSPDGKSAYSRSKYGVSQQSVMSYYSQQTVSREGTAIGVEHVNETLGMNMRHQYLGGSSESNGRLNTAQWLKSKSGQDINGSPGPPWTTFVTPKSPLQIPALTRERAQGGWTLPDRTIASGNPHQLPDLTRSAGAGPTFNDPQPTSNYNIEGINACLNRNRDNNGNGEIDPDELRWYVPAIDQYLHIILGSNSLTDPLMPYERIYALPKVLNHQWSTAPNAEVRDWYYSRYMFMASNDGNNVMWCMEGTSTSTFYQANEWSDWYTRPWNLRCIRNLGSNLTDVQAEVKVTPAFVHSAAARSFAMTYYNMASIRVNPYLANGTLGSQMPVHTITSPYNSVYYGFEYAPTNIRIPAEYRPTVAQFEETYDRLITYIYSNPCEKEFGEGWRVPNQKELTMIRNVGGILTHSSVDACWVSCTVNYFNYLTGVGSDNTIDEKLFLVLLPSHGAQLTKGNLESAKDNMFLRCVRDKR